MSTKQRVLVIDASNQNFNEIKNNLKIDYEIVRATTLIEATNLCNSKTTFSALILDIASPVDEYFAFIENFYIDLKNKNIPLIVVSSIINTDLEIKSLKYGAWDYIQIPFDKNVLQFRLKNALVRCRLNNLDHIKYLAEFDTLTGIYNKNKFFDMTRDMLSRFPERTFIFLRIDIDRFKMVNTFFGSEEGDNLLKYIANGLNEKMRKRRCCTYGRINSDRFAICMEINSDIDKFTALFTDRFKKFLEEYGMTYSLVFSVGAYVIEDNSMPVELIYDRATMAANKCKGNDMIFCSMYDKKMSDDLIQVQEISNEMNDALENGQFVVYLQPKYDLSTGKISGAEALARWIHPTKGIVSPDDFISVFEKNGFIQKLDEFVWDQTCKYIRDLIDSGVASFPISVNMSRVDTMNAKLCDKLVAIISKYGLSPKDLSIEITESAYIENNSQMVETINKLKSCGFMLEMDDFGKGYSSLNMLSELPIDKLKLDMRFLQKKQTETKITSADIIKLICDFAKNLDLNVIAEGIETEEDLDFLQGIGCGYGQGYYFSKPIPYQSFKELVISNQAV